MTKLTQLKEKTSMLTDEQLTDIAEDVFTANFDFFTNNQEQADLAVWRAIADAAVAA